MKFVVLLAMLFSFLFADRDGGPYIDLLYGQASIKPIEDFEFSQDRSKFYGVNGGAFINRNLSVEMEYIDGIGFEEVSNGEFSMKFFDFNTQAHYPFYDEMFDVFAKFGVGYGYKQGSAGFAMVFGGGLAYRINDRFSLKAVYDYFTVGIDTTNNNSADITMKIPAFYAAIEVQF